MNLKKREPEKFYDQPSYHINKVLLFILYKIMISKYNFFANCRFMILFIYHLFFKIF